MDGSALSTPLPPHIQPHYYAAIIAAEAIGKCGNARVVELMINNSQIAGYAFYEKTRLVRAIFINSNAFLKSSTVTRTSIHLDLGFTGSASATPTSFIVKRLSIEYDLNFVS